MAVVVSAVAALVTGTAADTAGDGDREDTEFEKDEVEKREDDDDDGGDTAVFDGAVAAAAATTTVVTAVELAATAVSGDGCWAEPSDKARPSN